MTCSESSEVGLARFFSNRGSEGGGGGGGCSIHTPIPSQFTRRERNNNSCWFVSQTIAGKLGAFRRVTVSSVIVGGGRCVFFMRGAPRVPLLIRLGAFDAHCRFLAASSGGAGVARVKSSDSDQISPKAVGRAGEREGGRKK